MTRPRKRVDSFLAPRKVLRSAHRNRRFEPQTARPTLKSYPARFPFRNRSFELKKSIKQRPSGASLWYHLGDPVLRGDHFWGGLEKWFRFPNGTSHLSDRRERTWFCHTTISPRLKYRLGEGKKPAISLIFLQNKKTRFTSAVSSAGETVFWVWCIGCDRAIFFDAVPGKQNLVAL